MEIFRAYVSLPEGQWCFWTQFTAKNWGVMIQFDKPLLFSVGLEPQSSHGSWTWPQFQKKKSLLLAGSYFSTELWLWVSLLGNYFLFKILSKPGLVAGLIPLCFLFEGFFKDASNLETCWNWCNFWNQLFQSPQNLRCSWLAWTLQPAHNWRPP